MAILKDPNIGPEERIDYTVTDSTGDDKPHTHTSMSLYNKEFKLDTLSLKASHKTLHELSLN